MLGYLDAGSGSMIATAAAAGFAGAAVGAKMGWQRLTGKFKRGSSEEEASAEAQDDPEAETKAEAEVAAEDQTAG
jgi:hypothetical protein